MPAINEAMSPEEPSSPRGEFSPLSLARMVWKRKLCIAAVWLVVTAGVVAVVRSLPAVYSSEAVILVDSQKIPEKFVSATVASDLQDRIATIRQEVLSSGRLKKIIDDFGLYRKERGVRFEEEILEMMRRDISITLEPASGANRAPGAFRIGYQGPDPVVVTQVANRLTDLYIEENLKTREVQAEGTSEFLDRQLQEAKARLDELEGAISTYKLKHNGELPQQQEAIGGTLARLETELEANRDGINRAHQTKIILESSLATAEGSIASMRRSWEAASATDARRWVAEGAQPGVVARPRSEVLAEQLDQLRTRYREDYPDVAQTRAELELARRAEERERAAAAGKTSAASSTASARPRGPEPAELTRARDQAASLKSQLTAIDQELDTRKAQQERILRDIGGYQSRIERLPVREQELAQITRDYEICKENYKSLLDKKNAAGMALDMERRQKSERFTVLDPARRPEMPVKPKRPVLYAGGSAAGLVLALIVGFVVERRQNVVLGEWELPDDVTILARLPYIEIPCAAPSPARSGPRGTPAFPLDRA